MANRTLYFEITTTKFTKEFLSVFFEYHHFIGSIILYFNGRRCNNYMYTDKGVVNLFINGASAYYNKYGFDLNKTQYFDRYTINNNYRTHSFYLTIDENMWSLALEYGSVINKTTKTINIPSGKDVYKVVCEYKNGFEPKLVLVESYASKIEKQRREEAKKYAEQQALDHQNKLNKSYACISLAESYLSKFKTNLNNYFNNVDLNRDDYTFYQQLSSDLSLAISNYNSIPYKDLWDKESDALLNLEKRELTNFYNYIVNKISISHNFTIFDSEYGKMNENHWNNVLKISKDKANNFIDTYHNYLINKDWVNLCNIPLDDILYMLWAIARIRPFDSLRFNKISELYRFVYQK